MEKKILQVQMKRSKKWKESKSAKLWEVWEIHLEISLCKMKGILPVGVKPLGAGCAVEAWPWRLLPCLLGAGCLLKGLLSWQWNTEEASGTRSVSSTFPFHFFLSIFYVLQNTVSINTANQISKGFLSSINTCINTRYNWKSLFLMSSWVLWHSA